MPTIPDDYVNRVYAGVLGKLIGVYLGRPFEGWSCERITERFGEIDRYVHDDLGAPLIVADDDISGTFTFLRAFEDGGLGIDTTSEAIGEAWLNYIVPNRTVLWWGGIGVSTEHTAFANLQAGVPAPRSGSAEINGRVVAEQIGAQIFIDGWGLVSPGDPALAARLARRAGSVSHDGAAVDAAVVVASMEAAAFVESDIERLLDIGIAQIDSGCLVRRLIDDIREWHASDPGNWRAGFERVRDRYGYERYGGGCHIIPNHALIVLALLYGDGDFGRSLSIVNTCGWDTDCNSGNVGCLLGVRGGLGAIDSATYDWRGPVADRLYLPTADGARCVTDAVSEAVRIANMGRRGAGLAPVSYKGGAKYHFSLPGSLQGWSVEHGRALIDNALFGDDRVLRVRIEAGAEPVRVGAPTFPPHEVFDYDGYGMVACPSLYPGQRVTCEMIASTENRSSVGVALCTSHSNSVAGPKVVRGNSLRIAPGERTILSWVVPDGDPRPICRVSLEIAAASDHPSEIFVDRLTWDGPPRFARRIDAADPDWKRGWVDSVTASMVSGDGDGVRLMQDAGVGLLIGGAEDWTDYCVDVRIVGRTASSFGLAGRVQGLRRYYALLLGPGGRITIVKQLNRETRILGAADLAWASGREYDLRLDAQGNRLRASVDGRLMIEVIDGDRPFLAGAIAVAVSDGAADAREVRVAPAALPSA